MRNILSKMQVSQIVKSVVILMAICFVGFASGEAYAEHDNPNKSTLTVSTVGDIEISLDVLPIYSSGTFMRSNSAFGFTVKTDHYSGYTAEFAFYLNNEGSAAVFNGPNNSEIHPIPEALEKILLQAKERNNEGSS